MHERGKIWKKVTKVKFDLLQRSECQRRRQSSRRSTIGTNDHGSDCFINRAYPSTIDAEAEVFGGLILTSARHHESFFGELNIDNSSLFDCLPGVTFCGTICGKEIGNMSAMLPF